VSRRFTDQPAQAWRKSVIFLPAPVTFAAHDFAPLPIRPRNAEAASASGVVGTDHEKSCVSTLLDIAMVAAADAQNRLVAAFVKLALRRRSTGCVQFTQFGLQCNSGRFGVKHRVQVD
jgi:hypothetical protein